MRYKKSMLVLAMIFLLSSLSLSARAQEVNISARLLNPNVRVFFLSDFNFTGQSVTGGEIFELLITNSSNSNQECTLEIRISAQGRGVLASGRTRPFVLEPLGSIRITNRNLFSEAQRFSLLDYSIEQAGDELKDQIIATGKLPSDIYLFEFILTQMSTGYTSQAAITVDVTNPSTLDLISPGANAEDEHPPRIYTSLPYFRWESNMDAFQLVIAEKLVGVHDGMSPEEVMQDRIVFDRKFKVDPSAAPGSTLPGDYVAIPLTAYQYTSGDYPLQRGRTYYWQVKGIIESPSGPIELPSEIWAFRLARLDDQMMSPEQQQILNNLGQLLGSQFDDFMQSGGELEGFTPTGVIMLNGQPVSSERIMGLIRAILSGRYEVVEVTIE